MEEFVKLDGVVFEFGVKISDRNLADCGKKYLLFLLHRSRHVITVP